MAKLREIQEITVCGTTAQMLAKGRQEGVSTAFDRADDLKPCPIGAQNACCKHCFMGPCRLSSKAPYEKVGVCGSNIDTFQARGFARAVAAGTAAHSDHGREMAELFYSVAKETLFVRPVRPDAAQLLSAPFSPPRFPHSLAKENVRMLDVNRLPVEGEGGLLELLRTLTDPRKRRGVRHPLVCIVAIATCACLAGARSFEAMAQWAKELSCDALKRLGGKRPAPPSEKCLRLTLQRLDAVALDRQLGEWLTRHNLLPGKAIAVDGKTLRGAHDGPQPAPRLLTAVIHQEGIVIAQHPVGDETNEIPCLPPLLDGLPLQGVVVTADALHTQTETARVLNCLHAAVE